MPTDPENTPDSPEQAMFDVAPSRCQEGQVDPEEVPTTKEIEGDSDTVTISKEEYAQLTRNNRMLAALEAGGVDNWEWYSESLKDFHEEDEDECEDESSSSSEDNTTSLPSKR